MKMWAAPDQILLVRMELIIVIAVSWIWDSYIYLPQGNVREAVFKSCTFYPKFDSDTTGRKYLVGQVHDEYNGTY